jgi:hypothetical protein
MNGAILQMVSGRELRVILVQFNCSRTNSGILELNGARQFHFGSHLNSPLFVGDKSATEYEGNGIVFVPNNNSRIITVMRGMPLCEFISVRMEFELCDLFHNSIREFDANGCIRFEFKSVSAHFNSPYSA